MITSKHAPRYIKIKNLTHLRKLASKEVAIDTVVWLNGGVMSRKRIAYDEGEPKPWWILNYIDDSVQELTGKQLFNPKKTYVGEALMKGALYMEVL